MKPPSIMKKLITIFIFLALFITQQAKAQFIRDAEIENLLEDYSNPIFLAAGLKPDEVHIGVINNKSLNAFVACSHMSCESSGATAFVICNKCETVQEICDESISNFLSNLARKTKIKASKSSIELHGLCNGCSAVSHS